MPLNRIPKNLNDPRNALIDLSDEFDMKLQKISEEIRDLRMEIVMSRPKDGKDADEYAIAERVLGLVKIPKQREVDEQEITRKLKNVKEAWVELSQIKGFSDYMYGFGSDFLQKAKAFSPRALASLYDVQITAEPTDGQTITWSKSLRKWVLGSGSGSGGSGLFETPVGTINGSNTTFTVSNTPVYITFNGQTLYENYGYTRSSLTLTLDTAPRTGVQNGTGQDDVIRSHY